MSHKPETAAVIISRRHQSAPKEHWIDKDLRAAAEEIDAGNYVPELDGTAETAFLDSLPLALRHGKPGWEANAKPTPEDIQETRDLRRLGDHPRVAEALERLQLEAEDAKTSEELTETLFRMHEINAMKASAFKWDGQERWQGSDAEESRIGKILTPIQFWQQLSTVIGNDRVILGRHAVKVHAEDESARVGLFVRNPEWTGIQDSMIEMAADKVKRLRDEGESEMRRSRQYAAAGMAEAAKRAMGRAGDLAMEAMRLLQERDGVEAAAPKEFLRVATLQWPANSEWMVMNFDEYGIPSTPKYLGWRTALLSMVRARVITEREAHEAFPATTVCESAAEWYRRQLWSLRNERVM